jgi:hypothetical protein
MTDVRERYNPVHLLGSCPGFGFEVSVKWKTEGSSYSACVIVSGEGKPSRYYPRIITSALWME